MCDNIKATAGTCLLSGLFMSFSAAATPAYSPARDFGSQTWIASAGSSQVFVRTTSPISFGEFSLGPNGRITVDPRSGTCSAQGGAVMTKNICSRGVFEVHGLPGEQVMVSLPAQSSMNPQMIMTNFTTDKPNPLVIGADGRVVVGYGATLTSPTNVKAGAYSGDFQIQATVFK